MTSRGSARSRRAPRMMRNKRTRTNDNSVGTYVGDAWSLAKRTALGLNEIRKLINVEQKYFDFSNLVFAPTQAGVPLYLCGMGQGDDITQRDGDSVKVQRFRFAAQITRNPASVATGEWVRIIVVRDLQNSGVTVTGADVIAQASSTLATCSPYNVLNGSAYNKRFSIVMDEVVYLDANKTCDSILFTSNHDCHIYFRGTTANITNAGNGTYHALCFTNVSTTLPSIDMISRIEFTDN